MMHSLSTEWVFEIMMEKIRIDNYNSNEREIIVLKRKFVLVVN